jgi:hypothetical protein
VVTLESKGKKGNMSGVVVVLRTHDSTAEAAANEASSSSPQSESAPTGGRPHQSPAIKMWHAQLTFSHVAGERIKDQGTDDMWRGRLKEGIAIGKKMI